MSALSCIICMVGSGVSMSVSGLFGQVVVVVVHVCVLCLWIVFGRSFVQFYFDSVYVVVLGGIVLILLSYVQLCLVFCVGILCLCSSTSCNCGFWVVSICICMM
jgi:hypothetical protein